MDDIRISVRELVEFLLRSGNIDNRRKSSSERAMMEGSRIHKLIQKRGGSSYHAEVPLVTEYDIKNFRIRIEGRADGIIEGDPVMIDEIKGTYRHLDKIQEPDSVHLAQAKCYAYMYIQACKTTQEQRCSRIGVRMTYCNMDTEEIRCFSYEYTDGEINQWFARLMEQYERWADFTFKWKKNRQLSIKEMEFPFPYRDGQKELVLNVYRTIVHERKLFLEAPTGVGKTISTLFPALKAIGENKADRVFYLTAKTVTGTVANETFEILRKKGLLFKSVFITAKDKICLMEERECNPEYCPYAKGHFDRINEALYGMITQEDHMDQEIITRYAQQYMVCPFEFSLDAAVFADGIICDYNYLFDPHVCLKRFFAENKRDSCLFLIDEAHNLVERGREMYSAALVKEDFLSLKKTIKVYDKKIESRLEKCNREFLNYKRECEKIIQPEDITSFVRALTRLYDAMEEYLDNHEESPVRKEVLDFYFQVSHFLLIYEKTDERYVTYASYLEDGSFYIKLFCVDPSKNLEECLNRGVSAVLFSATLLPVQYYKSILGGREEDYEVYAHTAFDSDKRLLVIASDVTSRYAKRNVSQYQRIASYIYEIVCRRRGNYMVFFPSHIFLRHVYEEYQTLYENDFTDCILQSSNMNEEDRREFIRRFTKDGKPESGEQKDAKENRDGEKSLVGFCVMGGIFSEGIDLKNDSLIGAILVGTGVPLICQERELIRDFFDRKEGKGYDYAYLNPGMNKVLQAAGRVIRTQDDIGIVALLDDRFLQYSYQRLFPREWSKYKTVNLSNVGAEVKAFWDRYIY